MNPGFGLLCNCTYEMKGPNVGVIANYRCPTRDYFERTGGEVNLERICGETERRLLQEFARTVDQGILVKPLKVPGGNSRAAVRRHVGLADPIPVDTDLEPICQWAFRL